jgi:branched-chain amino acid transport system ATP-binding protein
MNMALLQVKNITVGYASDIDIIVDFSLRLEKGTTVSVIGPNGAGKSTLLKTIFGLLKPKEGEIVYLGESIGGQPPFHLIRKGISYMPQGESTIPLLTVEENLMMGAWTIRQDKNRVKKRIENILDEFPVLRKRKKEKATFLSGGQLKMLELARVLMMDPQLLLIDEPSSALDPKTSQQIYEIISGLSEKGISILLVEQNIRQAVNKADYVYLMELGKNAVEGPRDEFKKRLGQIIKASLLG